MAELTVAERATLVQCEREIDQGRKAWIVTGRALRIVRDAKLYREEFGTFEEYVARRWEMSRRTAYHYIDGCGVIDNVHHGAHFEHIPERHIRPLTKLDPEQQRKAWKMACDVAPKDDAGLPKLTAKIVGNAVEQVAPKDSGKVVHLPRVKEVTIPVADAERAVRILLKACEHRDLVELLSELGYTLHRIGATKRWPEAMREMLARQGAA